MSAYPLSLKAITYAREWAQGKEEHRKWHTLYAHLPRAEAFAIAEDLDPLVGSPWCRLSPAGLSIVQLCDTLLDVMKKADALRFATLEHHLEDLVILRGPHQGLADAVARARKMLGEEEQT